MRHAFLEVFLCQTLKSSPEKCLTNSVQQKRVAESECTERDDELVRDQVHLLSHNLAADAQLVVVAHSRSYGCAHGGDDAERLVFKISFKHVWSVCVLLFIESEVLVLFRRSHPVERLHGCSN